MGKKTITGMIAAGVITLGSVYFLASDKESTSHLFVELKTEEEKEKLIDAFDEWAVKNSFYGSVDVIHANKTSNGVVFIVEDDEGGAGRAVKKIKAMLKPSQ